MIDTVAERMAAQNVMMPWRTANIPPDGSIGTLDRLTLGKLYPLEVTTASAGFICIKNASIGVPIADGSIGGTNAAGSIARAYAEATIKPCG